MSRVLGDSNGGIGSTAHSMLTEVQYQALYGPGWILSDGRSVVGSKYTLVTTNSNVPDCRGYYIRGKDNGSGHNPDGDISLGSFQSDQFASHNHGGGNHDHGGGNHGHSLSYPFLRTWNRGSITSNALDGPPHQINPEAISVNNSGNIISPQSVINTQGGNENRPASVTMNVFIRIN